MPASPLASRQGFFLYTSNFRDGVRRLKEDEIGVYILVLTLIYESADGTIADDERAIAQDLGRDVRVWRRVRARLLELGKLQLAEGRLANKRAGDEIERREERHRTAAEAGRAGGKASGEARRAKKKPETSGEDLPNFSRTSAGSSPEVRRKSGGSPRKNNDLHEPFTSTSTSTSTSLASSAADAAEQQPRGAADRPLDRCIAAAGPGLADPSKHASLHLSAPRIAAAIAAGCDLDLDILPVVEARTAKPRANPIRTWSYFERAWADARDDRLAEFAQPDLEKAHEQHRQGISSTAGAQRRGSGSLVAAARRAQARREARRAAGAAGADCNGADHIEAEFSVVDFPVAARA